MQKDSSQEQLILIGCKPELIDLKMMSIFTRKSFKRMKEMRKNEKKNGLEKGNSMNKIKLIY